MTSPLGFLVDEAFWLYLFFVTSGYLLAQTKIGCWPSLIEKCVKRFLRLAFPVLFASIGIYILLQVIGIYSDELSTRFDNSWLQSSYAVPLTMKAVILSPFDILLKGNVDVNAPYWVLPDMLKGSLLIYVFLFLSEKLPKTFWSKLVLSCVCLCISSMLSPNIFACTFGMVTAVCQNVVNKLLRRFPWVGAASIAVLMGIYYVLPTQLLKTVIFAVIILSCPWFTCVDEFLSTGIPHWLGKICFGIYSFHWPIFCSIGSFFLLKAFPRVGIVLSFSASSLISITATLIIAHIYFLTAEKYASSLTKNIMNVISSILAWVHK